MRRVVPIVLLCALIPLHVYNLRSAVADWKALPRGEEKAYAIPSALLKLTSLEFDGLAADFMFLRSMVFYGKTLERTERPRVKEWEWQQLYSDLDTATDLDPQFYDPYNFAQGILVWEGNKVAETNQMLQKGIDHREWDWMLPFYVGFNNFYFLKDDARASEYLMLGARRPGAIPMLASLATRLAVKGSRTENAILFLFQMLKTEEDESTREVFKTRLEALQGVLLLERAVAAYTERFGQKPEFLDDLVEAQLIKAIPLDPYGGEFYVEKDGAIRTTSDFMDKN